MSGSGLFYGGKNMTVYELILELKKYPEDAEVIIYEKNLKWQNTIDDKEPFSLEHNEDGTPILFLSTEG